MRDPHVVRLRYKAGPALDTRDSTADPTAPDAPSPAAAGAVTYLNPPPIERDVGPFSLRLADGVLTVILADHHPDEASARAAVERYLRSWEISAALQLGRGALAFQFERADIIDRDPLPPVHSPGPVAPPARAHGAPATAAPPANRRRQYPEPPDGFAVSPDVETLWHRYQGYLDGKEPIGGLARFVLDFVTSRYGGEQQAAALLGISREVLQRLRQLCAEYDDLDTRREFIEPSGPATDRERAWLEAAAQTVIRRLGEWSADPDAARPEVTMGSLPKLR